MTTRIQANAAIKAEMKSFEMCVSTLLAMRNLPEVKSYLSEREITADYLKKKTTDGKQLFCKVELFHYVNLHEFTAANGTTYKAIFRKDKYGNIVQANWSIWRVLCAIDKMYMAKKDKKSIKEAVEAKMQQAKAIKQSEEKQQAIEEERASIIAKVRKNRATKTAKAA